VATKKVDEVTITKELALRAPAIVVLRTDKAPAEADTLQSLEERYRKERLA
jgi:hypothetical protein